MGDKATMWTTASNTQTINRCTEWSWPFVVKLKGQRNWRTSQGHSHFLDSRVYSPGSINLGPIQQLVKGLEISIWFLSMWDLVLEIQVANLHQRLSFPRWRLY